MKTIWKFFAPSDFRVGNADECVIEMPKGAKILHATLQPHDIKLVIWAEVDNDSTIVGRHLRRYPTGGRVVRGGQHLITYIYPDLTVWHIYDYGEMQP